MPKKSRKSRAMTRARLLQRASTPAEDDFSSYLENVFVGTPVKVTQACLQCSNCGQLSSNHARQLSHLAACHPCSLNNVVVGRLGNILMYQSSVRLFHCAHCFFTCKDFTKLFIHIISKHCSDQEEGEEKEEGVEEEEEVEEKGGKRKIIEIKEEEEDEGGVKMGKEEGVKRKRSDEAKEEEDKRRRIEVKEDKEGDGEKRKTSDKAEEDEESKLILKRSGEEEQEEGGQGKRSGEEEQEEGGQGKRSGEEEEGEGAEEGKAGDEGGEGSWLKAADIGYHCLICGWRNKLKVLAVNHMMRKHDLPKECSNKVIRRDDHASSSSSIHSGAEEEEASGLSGELLKEEMEATAKVVHFISNHFVCITCGWKSKLKGFTIRHVSRAHDVERPYKCKACTRSFFLPSRLHQHVKIMHRPGRYACPFCPFRSQCLGGLRRHCGRCNALEVEFKEEKEERGGGEEQEDEEEEVGKETEAERELKTTVNVVEEEEKKDD